MRNIRLSAPGLICCAGKNRNELYESCLNGRQDGIIMVDILDSGEKSFPIGQIQGDLPEIDSLSAIDSIGGGRIFRFINTALEQIRPDIEHAIARYGPEKIGVCLGSCDNGSELTLLAHQALFTKGSFPENYNINLQSAWFTAEFIARKFGLSGPVFTCATACASGASAIIRGAELIQAGLCGAVIAGGADIVSKTVFAGFHSLEAVSDSITNPFSKNRKGINLGDGAAFFLLDSSESSEENSAENSTVELLGAGESADADHMTAPDAEGAARAMRAALSDAGLDAKQIGYINLHGTGTELNDKAEALAMKAVFNEMPPISSTKPITGHTLGAAGALEAAICWMVLTERRGLPVHCWDGVRDGEIPVSPVKYGDKGTPSICMSNSLAFGGCNVSLIMGRG